MSESSRGSDGHLAVARLQCRPERGEGGRTRRPERVDAGEAARPVRGVAGAAERGRGEIHRQPGAESDDRPRPQRVLRALLADHVEQRGDPVVAQRERGLDADARVLVAPGREESGPRGRVVREGLDQVPEARQPHTGLRIPRGDGCNRGGKVRWRGEEARGLEQPSHERARHDGTVRVVEDALGDLDDDLPVADVDVGLHPRTAGDGQSASREGLHDRARRRSQNGVGERGLAAHEDLLVEGGVSRLDVPLAGEHTVESSAETLAAEAEAEVAMPEAADLDARAGGSLPAAALEALELHGERSRAPRQLSPHEPLALRDGLEPGLGGGLPP